jgi:hypothetical protein
VKWLRTLLLTFLIAACAHIPEPPENTIVVQIVLHVESQNDADYLISSMLGTCKKAFESANVVFDVVAVYHDIPTMVVEHDDNIISFRDLVYDDSVHVFFVDQVQGAGNWNVAGLAVYWSDKPCKSLIIIGDDYRDLTLAHEIGHFFGLDHRKKGKDNIMYTGLFRAHNASFTQGQIQHMRYRMLMHDIMCD